MSLADDNDWLAYRASLYDKTEAELRALYEFEIQREGRKGFAGLVLLAAFRRGYHTWDWGLPPKN